MSLYFTLRTSRIGNIIANNTHLYAVISRLTHKYIANQKSTKNSLQNISVNKKSVAEPVIERMAAENLIGYAAVIKKPMGADLSMENKAGNSSNGILHHNSVKRIMHSNYAKSSCISNSQIRNEQLAENKISIQVDRTMPFLQQEREKNSRSKTCKKLYYKSALKRLSLYFQSIRNFLEQVCLFFILPEYSLGNDYSLGNAHYDKKNMYLTRKKYYLSADRGATTAEYAIVILAATAFAGALLVILKSDTVKQLLLGIIKKALNI